MHEVDSTLFMILLSLMFSALFSGVEIAFISSDKLAMELERNKGSYSAKIIMRFYNNSSKFIGTTLIGNTLALVVYGIFMANMVEMLNSSWQLIPPENEVLFLLVQTTLSTIIVLFTAEFTPKSLFLLNPNRSLLAFAIPMSVIYFLLAPAVRIVMELSKWVIVNIMKLDYSEDKPIFGRTDLNNYIRNRLSEASHNEDSEVDTKIFSNALEFKKTLVRECMIPRTDIVSVELNDTIEELAEAFTGSGHSKVLVYKDSIDDIIGYCHSTSLFERPQRIKEIIQPITFVTETKLASELLLKFMNDRKSIALVLDEYGGTAGLVTIEDVMEEIFGDIQDEHDQEDWTEYQIDEHTFLLSARHEIDNLNERYDWMLPEGDYDTLGGLILSQTGEIPRLKDEIAIGRYRFIVEKMDENRIDTVRMEISKDEEE
ncbi:MAG: hemolysin family protein [Cytophagales bacterium]|nr:hemolysin family protein [Cytophagales bacterium]